MKNGIEEIAAERERQISKCGWTPEHDKGHRSGELNDAAVAYATAASWLARGESQEFVQLLEASCGVPWPWESKYWNPDHTQVGNLIKAGALIAAEIDRLKGTKP